MANFERINLQGKNPGRSMAFALACFELWRLARVALVCLVLSLVSLAQPLVVCADQAQPEVLPPAYVVRKGDTLSGIGRKQGLSVARLKSLNGLRSDRLKPGQRLVLGHAVSSVRLDATLTEIPPSDLWSVIESYIGTPYRFGGTGPDGIDCSGFVQKVFLELDVTLPRSAREQYWYGEEIDRSELHSGDLLFFRTYAKYPSHVGIYLGDGKMVHASARSRRVVASDINQPYYRKRFIGAKRLAGISPTLFDSGTLDTEAEETDESDEEDLESLEPAPVPAFNLMGQEP